MSHFSVLVIGENVEQQLAPYHEFECTGVSDQYVVDVDKTDEARESYEKDTSTRYRDPDGVLHEPYANRFYREPTPDEAEKIGIGGTGSCNGLFYSSRDWGDGKGYRAKVHFLPEGWEEVKVPRSAIESFRDYCESYYGVEALVEGTEPDLEDKHKYGYVLVNAKGEVIKLIDRTNPNAEWDWWVIGGRWTGWLQLKPGARGSVGRPGLLTPPAEAGTADIALKRDVDFEAMRDEKGAEAAALWDKAKSITTDTWESWESVRERFEKIDDAREFYHSQPALKALKESKDDAFSWDIKDTLAGPRDAFVQAARDRATSPYAIVHQGQWFAKGEMGWWGVSHNEVTQDDWNRRVSELLDSLPDDTKLTVVDCHI